MTRDQLLAEQFTPTSPPPADPPRPLTSLDQARHRVELLAALGAVAPTHRARQDLIDDLPPGPGPTLTVRAVS